MTKTTHTAAYNPCYDPMTDVTPGKSQDYAPTFWLADAGLTPVDDGPVNSDMDVDVAIIGSGYTGLTTAIYLAKEHGIKAVVLEANQVSYGCSSRNGGQAQIASGRLKRSQWLKKYGKTTALKLHEEVSNAMENFKDLISDIDCDAEGDGHFYIAHKPSAAEWLKNEVDIHNKIYGLKSSFIDAQPLRDKYVNDHEAHGAMFEPEGISIQPVKLAFGYLDKARALGAKVYTSSPVSGWETINGVHHLKTPGGIVKAKKVAIATGGYTSNALHPSIKNKVMPVLSNNLVTRVLTDEEFEELGIKTGIPLTDTRVLRHYYRLLPSKRIQIGSRSAITGKDAPKIKYQKMLEEGMHRKFPVLKNVEVEYSWWGWVDVSHDMMPRVTAADKENTVFYALGYGGNGVMYASQAGMRMAELIAEKKLPEGLPIFNDELPYPIAFKHFEAEVFSPFRRIGQGLLYQWYWLNDEDKIKL